MDESVVKVFEEQRVGALMLSAAIRIGSKIRPQCKHHPFHDGASCALGAAAEALGCRYDASASTSGVSQFLMSIYPVRRVITSICLHNDRGFTREEIADWAESQGL